VAVTVRGQGKPPVPLAGVRLDALVAQTFRVYDVADGYSEFVSGSRRGRIALAFRGLRVSGWVGADRNAPGQ
jgi:hypothetical protein